MSSASTFDPTVETPIPLAAVPRLRWLRKLRRRGGRPLHLSTVHRWAQAGLKIGSHVVKLEVLRIGGQLVTSEQALRRFFARCADPTADVDAAPKAAREHAAAEKALETAGI